VAVPPMDVRRRRNMARGRFRHARRSQHPQRRPWKHRQAWNPACACGFLARFPLGRSEARTATIRRPRWLTTTTTTVRFPLIPLAATFRPPALHRTGFQSSVHRQLLPSASALPGRRTPQHLTGLVNPVAPPVERSTRRPRRPTVADAARHPVLGIRGMVRRAGDPLHLPGYRSRFFVYSRLQRTTRHRH